LKRIAPEQAVYTDLPDYNTLTDGQKNRLLETWGCSHDVLDEFIRLRKFARSRTAFKRKWDDEPAIEYFEDFVHQRDYFDSLNYRYSY
jgi:hypothetical protein